MKTLLIIIREDIPTVDGPIETDFHIVSTTKRGCGPQRVARRIARTWYESERPVCNPDGTFEFFAERTVRVHSVQIIPPQHYQILRQYLTEL